MASRNNYYDFQSAKVAIAIELVKRGWKIYGFHEDESDSMTDYWSPAHWDGIAAKNGYVAVFDCSEYIAKSRSGKEIREYNYNTEEVILSEKTKSLIARLSEVRRDRGASASEEETAKKKIEALKSKMDNVEKVVVVDYFPVFQANPPKMSWHVEKDGVIIAKGRGLAKFADMKRFDKAYCNEILKTYSKDTYRYECAEKELKTAAAFEKFLNKIDSAAGCMLGGNGKGYVYENIEVTKYKKENKAFECAGSLKDGQCFIVKSHSFNHGICAGYVYRLHEHDGVGGKKYYTAIRLNGKLTKELTGQANLANSFGYISSSYLDKFMGWFDRGVLAWCEIKEIETPYTVQKCVKKVI